MIKLPGPAAVESTYGCTANGPYQRHKYHYTAAQLKRAIRDALEEAAQLVEKSTYRKRWAKAAVASQASNVPPCELATAIRKLKEDMQ